MYILFLPVVFLWTEPASGASTTFGTYFITTVPIMDHFPNSRLHYVVFELYTDRQAMTLVNAYHMSLPPKNYISSAVSETIVDTLETNRLSTIEANIRHYRFDSVSKFGITVFVFSTNSSASFVALPVDGWGKRYYTATLGQNPSIQILTHDAVRLLISFHFEVPKSKWYVNGLAYNRGNTLEVYIDKWDVYNIQNCTSAQSAAYNSWSGTFLMGDIKFGVVTGNCDSATEVYSCQNNTKENGYTTGDAAVEMLLPQESYGTEFMIPDFGPRETKGNYFLTSGDSDTSVRINEASRFSEVYFRTAGFTVQRRHKGPAYISSNYGMQVTFAWHSRCSGQFELGDVTLTTIIPTELFFYTYTWSVPTLLILQRDIIYFITILLQSRHIKELELNIHDEYLQYTNFSVPDLRGWIILTYMVNRASSFPNTIFTTEKNPFVCYVYGIGYSEGFMHAAGFISSPINDKCTRSLYSMSPGDLLDNDCDRKIDEELENQQDDDDDSLIDEDLIYLTDEEKAWIRAEIEKEEKEGGIVHGGWGEWGEWACTADCPRRTMVRNRLCNRPTPVNGGRYCKGESRSTVEGDCYKRQICPEDCPPFTWDVDCVGTCNTCREPCNKKTGVCDGCVRGYKSPNTGCNIPCGYNEYGINCKGNCTEKCFSDCYERINGTCPVHGMWGRWSEWTCTMNCKDSKEIRKRRCNRPPPSRGGNPCPGLTIDYRNASCYKNTQCQEDCPAYRWDINCTESCENCIDECDKFRGSCKRCRSGYKKPEKACLIVCQVNEYGENCEGDCLTKCAEDCYDRVSGICSVHGGWTEWDHWHCTNSCRESREMRKRSCTRPRPEFGGRNCKGNDTEFRSAMCYRGVTCSEDCPPYSWDLNCVQRCNNCIDDCNKVNGSCMSCNKGHKFPLEGCQKECSEYEFGENCQGNCMIKCGEDCYERKNGECPVHGHWGVWSEWACADCPHSHLVRTRKCDNPEPNKGGKNCEGLPKDVKKSNCYAEMIYCYEDCPLHTWSLNCSKSCANCADDCNKYNGICTDCKEGFKNPNASCTTHCEKGEYGKNCLGNCTEKCGEDCEERVYGSCPVYGSWQIWQEWHCTRFCNDTRRIRYRECEPVHKGKVGQCKDFNYEMSQSDCYEETLCPSDCPEFHWNTDCRKCDHCKYECDKFNGSCLKCLPGYRFPNSGCEQECAEFTYGQDCLQDCKKKCASDCVNRVTGDCPSTANYWWLLLLLSVIPIVFFCLKPNLTNAKFSTSESSPMTDTASEIKIR